MNKRLFQLTKGFFVFTLALLVFASCQKNNDSIAPENFDNEAFKRSGPKGTGTIVDIAVGAGFTELVDALTYVDTALNANLIPTLSGNVQYTVFAPDNEAFENLYTATGAQGITDLPAELVLDVLLYHVTNGRRAAKSVVPKKGLKPIMTLLGEKFSVDPDAKIYAIGNTAQITGPDNFATNGVVHIISEVLLPIVPEEE
jgi:transforming growth factor-beta-induced protein